MKELRRGLGFTVDPGPDPGPPGLGRRGIFAVALPPPGRGGGLIAVRGTVAAATGAGTAVAGGAAWGGRPALAVLAAPFAAALVLLAWVLADAGRSRRPAALIKAARTPPPTGGDPS